MHASGAKAYLFHAGDPLHSSGHPHGALRRTSLVCASEASPKVPADRLGSGTGSPRFQRSICLSIYDLMPRAPPKLDFVFIFKSDFKISMKFVCFGGPFFPAMWGLNGEMSAMRRFEQRCMRCVRDSMVCFLRFGPCDAKLRCASRDLRCAMRNS